MKILKKLFPAKNDLCYLLLCIKSLIKFKKKLQSTNSTETLYNLYIYIENNQILHVHLQIWVQ